MPLTQETAIFGHTSEDTALLVDDYPYGYTARTQIRYWIETTKNGDRFVSQTLNPKTDRWNKPKKSTYSDVGVMFRDEKGHVKWDGLSFYSDDEKIELFRSLAPNLSDQQKKKLAIVIGIKRAQAGVKVTIHEGPVTDEFRKEQRDIGQVIARRALNEAGKALGEL